MNTGRRIAVGRKVTAGTAIAVGAPVVTLLALVAQAPANDQVDTAERIPGAVPLVRAELGCAGEPSGPVVVGSAADETGTLSLRTRGGDDTGLALEPGSTTRTDEGGDLLLRADDGLARGLFAARLNTGGRPAAAVCSAPEGDYWYVGGGAGANHLTTLVLANPDPGPAVASVTLHGQDGELPADLLQDMIVPGGTTKTVDLEELAPTRGDLAIHLHVNRGRLAVTARDAYGRVGGPLREDGFTSSARPAIRLTVAGLVAKADQQVLTVVNPGEDEARVKLQVVGPRSTFAATGLSDVRLPAGASATLDLTAALKRALSDGEGALRLDSNVPVTAGVRVTAHDDLAQLPALAPAGGATATVLPEEGEGTLVLSAAEQGGAVTVTWLGVDDEPRAVRLTAGTTRVLKVPEKAWGVRVDGDAERVAVVRAESSKGVALLSLLPLVTDLMVPAVRPEWPPR